MQVRLGGTYLKYKGTPKEELELTIKEHKRKYNLTVKKPVDTLTPLTREDYLRQLAESY